MAIIESTTRRKVIDLSGPEGNAFILLGYAANLSKQLGHTKEEAAAIQTSMQSGDYENLVDVFDENFGEYVDLMR